MSKHDIRNRWYVKFVVSQLGEDELRDAIVLIYANKQDLPNAMSVSDVQQALGLQEYRGRKVRCTQHHYGLKPYPFAPCFSGTYRVHVRLKDKAC